MGVGSWRRLPEAGMLGFEVSIVPEAEGVNGGDWTPSDGRGDPGTAAGFWLELDGTCEKNR